MVDLVETFPDRHPQHGGITYRSNCGRNEFPQLVIIQTDVQCSEYGPSAQLPDPLADMHNALCDELEALGIKFTFLKAGYLTMPEKLNNYLQRHSALRTRVVVWSHGYLFDNNTSTSMFAGRQLVRLSDLLHDIFAKLKLNTIMVYCCNIGRMCTNPSENQAILNIASTTGATCIYSGTSLLESQSGIHKQILLTAKLIVNDQASNEIVRCHNIVYGGEVYTVVPGTKAIESKNNLPMLIGNYMSLKQADLRKYLTETEALGHEIDVFIISIAHVAHGRDPGKLNALMDFLRQGQNAKYFVSSSFRNENGLTAIENAVLTEDEITVSALITVAKEKNLDAIDVSQALLMRLFDLQEKTKQFPAENIVFKMDTIYRLLYNYIKWSAQCHNTTVADLLETQILATANANSFFRISVRLAEIPGLLKGVDIYINQRPYGSPEIIPIAEPQNVPQFMAPNDFGVFPQTFDSQPFDHQGNVETAGLVFMQPNDGENYPPPTFMEPVYQEGDYEQSDSPTNVGQSLFSDRRVGEFDNSTMLSRNPQATFYHQGAVGDAGPRSIEPGNYGDEARQRNAEPGVRQPLLSTSPTGGVNKNAPGRRPYGSFLQPPREVGNNENPQPGSDEKQMNDEIQEKHCMRCLVS